MHGVRTNTAYENGARTLGALSEKHFKSVVEEYYPNGTFITFAGFKHYKPIRGQVVIMWHLNSPLELALDYWERSIEYYPNAIYLVNSPQLYEVLKEKYDRVHYLPRFIDPDELPKPKENKNKDVIWFGNVWLHHKETFNDYLKSGYNREWISKGTHGIGTNGRYGYIEQKMALDIINDTKKVYAIGLCAMEAKYLGCEVVEYDGKSYDIIYPEDAVKKLREILDREVVKTRQKEKLEKTIKPEGEKL